ncbi:MAG: hypothetical protein WCO51_11730 [bacterium]
MKTNEQQPSMEQNEPIARDWLLGILGLAFLSVVMLLYAIYGRPPYAYFQLLRYVVAGASGLGAWALFKISRIFIPLSCLLVGMGIVFVTTSMRRNQWLVFDWSAFAMFALLIVILLINLIRNFKSDTKDSQSGEKIIHQKAKRGCRQKQTLNRSPWYAIDWPSFGWPSFEINPDFDWGTFFMVISIISLLTSLYYLKDSLLPALAILIISILIFAVNLLVKLNDFAIKKKTK